MNISRKFTHLGKTFDWIVTGLPEPPGVSAFAAPGAGAISITPVILSPTILPAAKDVTLVTTVRGEAIAHIFVEALLYDEACGCAYGPVYREYLQAPDHKEVGGVPHPEWRETAAIHTTFKPTLRALSNGTANAFAFAAPEAYARPPETTTYSLRGRLAGAGGDPPREVKFSFDEAGRMVGAVGFGQHAEDDDPENDGGIKKRGIARTIGAFFGRGAPRSITPQPGDTFTPEGRVLLAPQDANEPWGEGTGTSTPLIFNEETPLHWEVLPLPPATYLVGIVVEDFDGKFTRKYAPLIILPPRGAAHEATAHSETRQHIPDARRRPGRL